MNSRFTEYLHIFHSFSRKNVEQEISANRFGHILDVCCGTGAMTLALATNNPAAEVVGVDFSGNMITIANHHAAEKALGNVEFFCEDANELHFRCGEYEDAERAQLIKQGVTGGVIALDGTGKNGHKVTNTVSLSDFKVIGKKEKSAYDDTVRLAPAFAFYQENIQSVINKNTVNPANPKEIFTGSFMFGEQGEFGDETGSLAYPSTIKDLLAKTVIEEGNQNG